MMTNKTPTNNLLFLSMIMLFTCMALNTMNWLLIWVALEVSVMSFIPMSIKTHSHILSSEAMFKYFMIQTISSNFMITTLLLLSTITLLPLNIILISSIMMKMGVAPWHLWLPSISLGLSWQSIITLTTVLKIPPLMMMTTVTLMNQPMSLWVVSINSLIGSMGAINQTQMRSLMMYSSITHMSWILLAASFSTSTMTSYMVMYMSMMIALLPLISKTKSSTTNNFNKTTNLVGPLSMMLSSFLLSLGGMPPLIGFFPKWLIISQLTFTSPLMILILIFSSSISIYYYLIITSSSLTSSQKPLNISPQSTGTITPMIMMLTPSPLLLTIT